MHDEYLTFLIAAGLALDGHFALRIAHAQIQLDPEDPDILELHFGDFTKENVLATKSAFNEAFDNLIKEAFGSSN